MNEIIILGSSGFIGKNVFSHLQKIYGENVIGFSSQLCNLLDSKEVSNVLLKYSKNVSYIFISGITRLQENSPDSFYKNINMIRNFLSAISYTKSIEQIVFLSTIDVYGTADTVEIISESTPVNPADYYSLSKYVSEFFLKDYCKNNKIPLIILRLSGVYGPFDEDKSTINKMVYSALSQKNIKLSNMGEDTRDFVYVKDLCQIIASSLNKKSNLLFNVATGQSMSIAAYAQEIITAINDPNIKLEYTDDNDSNRKSHLCFDISLLKDEFPHFSFRCFSESIIDYISENNYV